MDARKNPDTRLRDAGIKQDQCSAKTRAGERCKKRTVTGATVCGSHGGLAPQVRVAGIRRTAQQIEERLARAWEVVDAGLDEGDSGLAWRIISAQASLEAAAERAREKEQQKQLSEGEIVYDENGRQVDPVWAQYAQ